ncbi:COG1361 S-layer family protein [Halorhabdus amylolytica]|uniref:COG1361 S-layer family protein n=1 Tax=Halorhabdus amylolytica TaxID=2559573 RepID=UPI0010AB0098|nr:COG1361 S-layer family protein [Halorhabdus amylolytica]
MIRSIRSRSNRIQIALVVALLVGSSVAAIPGAVSAQQATQSVVGEPDITFSTASGSVTAGTASELAVSITNRGEVYRTGPPGYEDQVTTARAMTLRFKDGNVPIDVKSGEVTAGQSGAVPVGSLTQPVPITIAENTDPGTYKIPIEYEYLYTRQVEYNANGVVDRTEYTRTKTGSITVRVEEDARFEVIETNGTAQVGDTSDVSVTLENTGTQTAHSATVVASSQSGSMSFDAGSPSASAYIGEWAPDETRTVTYDVGLAPEASVREYTVGLTVNYEDSDGIPQQSGSLTAGIDTLPEQSFALSNVESTLRVGEDGEITGTIENTGPQPAGSVVVRYADDATTLIPIEQSAAVGPLDSGESASFTLPIEVNSEAEAGPKSIDLAVSYRNTDDEKRLYEQLDVRAAVAQERDQFEVALADRTVEAGGSAMLSVEVTNNLDETVSDVEGRLFADDPLDTGSTDTGYVESIEPGETATMTFELTAGSSAVTEKTYPISFDFRYDDADGDSKLSDTTRVAVTVVEPADDGGGLPLPLIGGGIVLLVALGGGYYYLRDR